MKKILGVHVLLSLCCTMLLATPASALRCDGNLDYPWGLVECMAAFNPNPFTCAALPNGGGVCQNPNAVIQCGGPFCPSFSVCQCTNGDSAPCLGIYVGGPAAGLRCYLMPQGNAGMTPEQKAAAAIEASVVGALGTAVGATCRHPACAIAAWVLELSSAFLNLIARVDPPDSNYLEAVPIVSCQPPYDPLQQTCKGGGRETFKKCTVTTAEAITGTALLDNMTLGCGIEDAIITTVNRLSTAIADGNAAGIELQINWLTTLKAEWAVQQRGTAPLREALATVLNQRQAGLGDVFMAPDVTAAELAVADLVDP